MRALRPVVLCAVLAATGAMAVAPSAVAVPSAAAPTLRAGGYAFTVPHAKTMNATVRVPRLSCGSGADRAVSVGVYGTYVVHGASTVKGGNPRPSNTPHLWSLAVVASCRDGAAHYAVHSRGYENRSGTVGHVHPGDLVGLSATATTWSYQTTDTASGTAVSVPPGETVEFRPRVIAGVRLIDTRSVHLHTLLSGVTGNGHRLGALHPHRVTQRKGGRVVVLPGAIRADRTSFPVLTR